MHKEALLLKDILFKVSEAGRQRVIEEQTKNIHAGVVGFIDFKSPETALANYITGWEEVTYNPYKYDSFVFKANKGKVTNAHVAYLSAERVFVK